MVEIKSTEEIMIEGNLWNNQRRKINPSQSDRMLKHQWVSLEDYEKLKKKIDDFINTFMSCKEQEE